MNVFFCKNGHSFSKTTTRNTTTLATKSPGGHPDDTLLDHSPSVEGIRVKVMVRVRVSVRVRARLRVRVRIRVRVRVSVMVKVPSSSTKPFFKASSY